MEVVKNMKKKIVGIFMCILVIVTVVPAVESLNLYPSISGFAKIGTREEWTQIQNLIASDGSAWDQFGYSVSLDGDTALIGARSDDDNGVDSGSAYVFIRNDNIWTQQAKLLASDGETGDDFGWTVDLSGDTALIGAYGSDDMGSSSGSAYIFTRTGTSWTQQAKLLASDGAERDHFGISVSLSVDTAIIGAPLHDDNGNDSGSAYVFIRTGTTWTQQAKLLAADGVVDDYFGTSVSIDGDNALIGATGDDGYKGSVYFFTHTGITWTQQQKILASDGLPDDTFGSSVSLFKDTAIIGANNDDDKGEDSGSAYIFTCIGSTWTQQAKLLASDGATMDHFGHCTSLYNDTAIIGGFSPPAKTTSESSYVFKRIGTTWTQQAKLVAGSDNRFGQDVSVSGNTALIGASRDEDKGSVYVFQGPNQPPNSPLINGLTSGKPKIAYQWNFTTIDPDDDDVFYQINWGDGTPVSEWYGSYHSGDLMSQSHAYEYRGTYTIKAKAKDIYGVESDWAILEVKMPRTYTSLVLGLFGRLPHAFQILRLFCA